MSLSTPDDRTPDANEPADDRGADAEGVQKRKSRLRKQKILEISSEMFGSKGFNGASLADIAGEVGITPAGILHHFKSKEILLTELLAARDSRDIRRAVDGNGVRPEGMDFLRHLVDTAAINQTEHEETRLYTVLSADSVTDGHPAQEWFRSRYEGLRRMIVTAIGKAREAGEITASFDDEETASAIVAVMDGLQVQWLLAPGSVDMAATTKRTIESLIGVGLGGAGLGGGGGDTAKGADAKE